MAKTPELLRALLYIHARFRDERFPGLQLDLTGAIERQQPPQQPSSSGSSLLLPGASTIDNPAEASTSPSKTSPSTGALELDAQGSLMKMPLPAFR